MPQRSIWTSASELVAQYSIILTICSCDYFLSILLGQMELLSRRKGTLHLNCCLPKNQILWWLRCSKHLCHRSAKEENSITKIRNCGSSMMYKYMPIPNSQTPWRTTWLSPAKTKHFSLSKTMTKPWST